MGTVQSVLFMKFEGFFDGYAMGHKGAPGGVRSHNLSPVPVTCLTPTELYIHSDS